MQEMMARARQRVAAGLEGFFTARPWWLKIRCGARSGVRPAARPWAGTEPDEAPSPEEAPDQVRHQRGTADEEEVAARRGGDLVADVAGKMLGRIVGVRALQLLAERH